MPDLLSNFDGDKTILLDEAVKFATNAVYDAIVSKYSCGWFDGGCYTLSSALAAVLLDAEIYHISRSIHFRDHAVIFISQLDLYIDADGVQSKPELVKKMRELEAVNVTVCEPFPNINHYPIYADIKALLINEMTNFINCSVN